MKDVMMRHVMLWCNKGIKESDEIKWSNKVMK